MSEKKRAVEIRKAIERDITVIQEIAEKNSLEKWSDADYRQELQNSTGLILTAEYEEQVIGFLLARLIMTYDDQLLSKSSGQ